MTAASKRALQKQVEDHVRLKKERTDYAALGLLGLAGLLLILYALTAPKKMTRVGAAQKHTVTRDELTKQRQEAFKRVNDYLKMLDHKIAIDRQMVEIQNQRLALHAESTRFEPITGEERAKAPSKINLEQESIAHEVLMDMQGFTVSGQTDELQQPINDYLADHQNIEHYNKAYRRAYIDKYLEEMRNAGYRVRLNENLEIVEIRPIIERGPSSLVPKRRNLALLPLRSDGSVTQPWLRRLMAASAATEARPMCMK